MVTATTTTTSTPASARPRTLLRALLACALPIALAAVFLWPPSASARAQTTAPAAMQSTAQTAAAPQVVEISAERFSFTPSEIKVKPGTPIEFRLRSDDTSHGFRILDTRVNVRIPKRGKGLTTVVFEPAKPGRYTFECSKLCGAGHSFMRGTLIVAE